MSLLFYIFLIYVVRNKIVIININEFTYFQILKLLKMMNKYREI